jgi:hypothetical protein
LAAFNDYAKPRYNSVTVPFHAPDRRSFLKWRYDRVVEGGNLPCPIGLHKYPNAEFGMRRKPLVIRPHDAAELIGNVRNGDAWRDKSDCHVLVF